MRGTNGTKNNNKFSIMKHALFSQNSDQPIEWFDRFDKDAIKRSIITHLEQNPTDTVEHCKEYSKRDVKKYYGMKIINFYQVNPKNGKPSKIVTRGNKEYFKALTP